jgi:hypothetical protein
LEAVERYSRVSIKDFFLEILIVVARSFDHGHDVFRRLDADDELGAVNHRERLNAATSSA